MAPELRKRKSKTELAAPAAKPAKAAATKAAKSPKVEKRKGKSAASSNEDASPIAKKKQKPTKAADVAASKKPAKELEEKEEVAAAPKKSALKKEKPAKKAPAAKKVAAPEPEEQEDAPASDAEEDAEVDVATEALVESLDSDNDDETSKKQVGTYKKGQPVGQAPTPKKGAKTAKGVATSGNPGVMYLGSIPHGFYEHEIREYFSQFGEITRLRVVRNKKTGASRHRAFVEFADAEVADIAARTMDSYLLFGHILKAKLVRPEQVHPELFKGANRRFNAVPWNAMIGRHLSRPLGESKWQGKVTKEEQRREARAEKLKALGYGFEAPKLKAPEAKEVAHIEGKENGEDKAVETEEPVKQIEEAEPEKAEPVTSISQKKEKKTKGGKGAKGKKVKA
ncbi:hypothetical protein OQA88_1984 [Cercophora sp. LCS_1]